VFHRAVYKTFKRLNADLFRKLIGIYLLALLAHYLHISNLAKSTLESFSKWLCAGKQQYYNGLPAIWVGPRFQLQFVWLRESEIISLLPLKLKALNAPIGARLENE